jgi:hypothetical protein
MPLPDALAVQVGRAEFWSDFYWETEAEFDPDDDAPQPYGGTDVCVAEFPVADGSALVLQLDPGLGSFSRDLRHPAARREKPVQTGWDDQAHGPPLHHRVLYRFEIEVPTQLGGRQAPMMFP